MAQTSSFYWQMKDYNAQTQWNQLLSRKDKLLYVPQRILSLKLEETNYKAPLKLCEAMEPVDLISSSGKKETIE
jgi:hypothetical protein